jgi:hypothetical protein
MSGTGESAAVAGERLLTGGVPSAVWSSFSDPSFRLEVLREAMGGLEDAGLDTQWVWCSFFHSLFVKVHSPAPAPSTTETAAAAPAAACPEMRQLMGDECVRTGELLPCMFALVEMISGCEEGEEEEDRGERGGGGYSGYSGGGGGTPQSRLSLCCLEVTLGVARRSSKSAFLNSNSANHTGSVSKEKEKEKAKEKDGEEALLGGPAKVAWCLLDEFLCGEPGVIGLMDRLLRPSVWLPIRHTASLLLHRLLSSGASRCFFPRFNHTALALAACDGLAGMVDKVRSSNYWFPLCPPCLSALDYWSALKLTDLESY